MIPAGFGEISVVHQGGGIDGVAIWSCGFDNNAGDTASEIADQVLSSLLSLDYYDILSTSCSVSEVRVKLGPDATGPSAVASPGLSGTIGGHAAPPNCALLVHKNTQLGGRRGRGRLFVPCLPEFALGTGGTVDDTIIGLAQTFFDSFGAGLTIGSLPPMLLHGDSTSPTAIDNFVVDARLATQRRRMRR